MTPYFQRDGITLYHADCRDILPSLPKVDLVLTDPPYGKKQCRSVSASFGSEFSRSFDSGEDEWDVAPSDVTLAAVIGHGKQQIIWGWQHFQFNFDPTNCILVWNKQNGDNPFADFESAWTNFTINNKIFNLFWLGSHARRIEPAYHPTQKPLALMKWCIGLADDPETILDPFAGSGTTLRAAMDLGRKAIGIEISEKYCEIAARRLEQRNLQFTECLA